MAKTRIDHRNIELADLFCHGLLSGSLCFCIVAISHWRFGNDGIDGVGFLGAGVMVIVMGSNYRKQFFEVVAQRFRALVGVEKTGENAKKD